MITMSLFAALALGEAHAAVRTWDCTHLNPVAPNNLRSAVMQGTLRTPTAIRLTNEATSQVMVQTRNPVPRPNYQGGYWFQHYGLDAYHVGDASGVRYVLLAPHGVLGAQFDMQVHENFAVGGSLQNEYSCVQR